MVLSDEQIDALDDGIDDFRVATYDEREGIVADFLESFEETWSQDEEFDECAVQTVRVPFTTLSPSHTFVAYSPASLRQDNVDRERTDSPNTNSDG